MKALTWITWISGTAAALLMLFGSLHFVFSPRGGFLGVNHAVNFFHVASSLLLLTICIQLYIKNKTTGA